MDSSSTQHVEISPDEHRPLASSQVEISHPSHNLEGSEASSGIRKGDHSSHASALPSSKQTSQRPTQKYKQKKTKSLAVCMVSTQFD